MSNSHFEQTVAWCAESYKIFWVIGFTLVREITTGLDVMYVQAATAWAALCAAILAYLVTATYIPTNSFPVAPMGQFLSAPIMWAIFASHKFDGAFARTKATSILSGALECPKGLAAILTVQIDSSYKTFVRTFRRAMTDFWCFLVKTFIANQAIGIRHSYAFPGGVTFTGTENALGIFADARGLTFKAVSAMVTNQCFSLSDGINCALARTMFHDSLICLKLFTTLEAGLDH